VERLSSRSEDGHEASDGRKELLAEPRDRYESPAHQPGVVTAGDAAEAVERALLEIVPLAAPTRRGRCAGDGCVHRATENVDSAPSPGP